MEADYLGSRMREHILSSLSRREITFDVVVGDLKVGEDGNLESEKDKWIIKDTMNRLGQWQSTTALEHRKGMAMN